MAGKSKKMCLRSDRVIQIEGTIERENKDSKKKKNGEPATQRISWPITDLGYEIYDVIGKGGNAIVNMARCIRNNKMCAIKRVDLLQKRGLNFVISEVQIMAKLLHPYLASFHTSFIFDTELWIVLDYYHFGSLNDIMMRDNGTTPELFNEKMIASIMRDVLRGLMYFHYYGFVHCDIKPGNILLRDNGSAVLSDFGSARRIHDKSPGLVTTPVFRAPELVSAEFLTSAADIWSLGMTAVNLSGEPLCHMARSLASLVALYREFAKFSELYRWVTTTCLIMDPQLRYNPWLQTSHRFFWKPMKKRTIVQIVSKVPQRALRWKREKRPYTDYPQCKCFGEGNWPGVPDEALIQDSFSLSWLLDTPVSTSKPNSLNSLHDTESGNVGNEGESVTNVSTAGEISANQVGISSLF